MCFSQEVCLKAAHTGFDRGRRIHCDVISVQDPYMAAFVYKVPAKDNSSISRHACAAK